MADGMKKKRKRPAKLCGANLVDGSGRTCGHTAGWGTGTGRGRCRKHGGNTRTHVMAAQREELAEAVVTFGLPVEIEPADALLDEIHRTYGVVLFLEGEIRKLAPAELIFGTAKESARTAGEGKGKLLERSVERRAGVVALVRLYQSERRHWVNVSVKAIAAGIAERQVKLAEQQGALVATAIRGILEDLDVADHPDVGMVVRRHLSVVRDAA